MPVLKFRVLMLGVMLTLLLLMACSADPAPDDGGPRLLRDSTLAPTTPAATRILSVTPPRAVTLGSTNEVLSPLEDITVQADFVLVTPTLPPSKTPTTTPTITPTQTVSPTPSVTVTATATLPTFPTSIVQPVTAVISAPINQVCDTAWFFEPRPASCPLAAPTAAAGVFQTFQNGYMIWVGSQDAIYVMYNDYSRPRWEVYRDQFDQGMIEDDPAYANAPVPNTWQPRRGFGMLWRGNEVVRNRIGWAIDELEIPFSVQVQTAGDGTFFVSDAQNHVFGLTPGGVDWVRYAGYAGFNN